MKIIDLTSLLTLLALPMQAKSFSINTPVKTNNLRLYSSIVSIEDELQSLAGIYDESERRQNFESFIVEKLQEEQLHWPNIRISKLPFAQDVNDTLIRLGQSVQDAAWEKHVVSGFVETPDPQKNVLWNFVDMLIQFKMLVKRTEVKRGVVRSKCGGCKNCKCKNNQL